MGNSGSMSGLSGYEEGYHHHPGYHHHHQRYHDAMRGDPGPGLAASWMDSYQRDHHRRGGPREHEPPQVKVLPDVPGKVAKLRSTNNGHILHAGGTISKNNQALQRSKSISSPTYQQHQQQGHHHQPASFSECDEELEMSSLQPPRMLMQRSRTQLTLLGPGRGRSGGRDEDLHDGRAAAVPERRPPGGPPARYGDCNGGEALNPRKRFGSEPDLRLSLLPRGPANEPAAAAGPTPRNPKATQSKIMKGKNKKKAPVPPVLEKRDAGKDGDRQRIIAYSPLRKGPDPAAPPHPAPSDGSFHVATTRKLRLFKTRAETKKTPTIAKLPEASDAKFPGKHGQPGFRPAGPGVLGLPHHHRAGENGPADEERPGAALDHLSARPNPASFFRREKTFDAGLLGLERAREVAPRPTMSPPLSRRKSIVKTLLERDGGPKGAPPAAARADPKPRQQVGTAAESYQRKMALAEAQRKQSAPAATSPAAITDFQKELQLATRTRKPADAGPAGAPASPARFPFAPGAPPGGKAKPNGALVIAVEPVAPAEEPKPDARDSPPPATPPPPPPPPKTSFYFGMPDGAGSRFSGGRFTGARMGPRVGDGCDGDIRPGPDVDDRSEEEQEHEEQQEHEHEEEQEHEEEEQEEGEEQRREAEEGEIGHTQMELIDQFAASLLNGSRFRSSDSVASSEPDGRTGSAGGPWDEVDGLGQQEIALKLRPTLPRKQFDIPRFSPAAAWRLLTTEDEFCRDGPADAATERRSFLRGLDQELGAEPAVPEDRIQRVYREPVPGLQDNKSGDSGISGDAGILADIGTDGLGAPPGKDDRAGEGKGPGGPAGGWSASAVLLMPWTPQQDLDDDDEEEEDDDDEDDEDEDEDEQHDRGDGGPGGEAGAEGAEPRHGFSSKGHLFSLSLPRENHLSIYNVEPSDGKVEKHVFNSLQKFRKSVTGAFKGDDGGGAGGLGDAADSNWFLGRLDTKLAVGSGPGPDARPKRLPDGRDRDREWDRGESRGEPRDGPMAASKHSSIGYLVSGKHMMYLPKEPTRAQPPAERGTRPDENNNRRGSKDRNGPHPARDGKENLQDPVPVLGVTSAAAAGAAAAPDPDPASFPVKLSNRRNHRFTFQSTIRQIEKRRVAEKLSREAEIKEAMRLSELEAMRRVEEEFQKKRAREKASIRHQLRLFSMETHPADGDGGDGDGDGGGDATGDTKRSDPDGDSLPHQGGGPGAGRGALYRKKEFASMERQYRREVDPDDEDGDGSSLGYVDTRTPYISRIIQAKSSKSYAGGKK